MSVPTRPPSWAASLTPTGAEKAGNDAGTIPAWEGGITRPPAGYKIGASHIDPFAADKVLYQVTPANFSKYADKLSAGQKAMFGVQDLPHGRVPDPPQRLVPRAYL